MKKYFSSRIICIILAFSMLFANISFVFATSGTTWTSSEDDTKVINALLEKAVYTNVTTDQLTSQDDTAFTAPAIVITNAMIEEVKAETGYKGNIYIREGKIYMIEGTDGFSVSKSGVKLDKGVSEERLRTYTFQLGSSSENYLDADGQGNNTENDMRPFRYK